MIQRLTLVVPLGLSLLLSLAASGEPPASISFEEALPPEEPIQRPSKLSWNPEGTTLVYQLEDEEKKALWVRSGPEWQARSLLTFGGEGALSSVGDVRWSPTGKELVLTHDHDLSLLDAASGELRPLTETEAEEEDPKFSPGGSHLAFVRDADLVVRNLETGAETALTEDGDGETILNGKTDWVYWEELWGRDSTGYWWSPDGRRLAYYRFEEQEVGVYPLVNSLPVYPEVTWQKYPKTGTTNPRVQVGVVPAGGGETTWLATGSNSEEGDEWYLARVHWVGPDQVAVERLHRNQERLDLLLCTVASGNCRILLTERSETWVNVGNETHFFEDGSFLWASERSGFRHLYLHGPDGKQIRQLTQGDGDVTSLDHVDEAAGFIIVQRPQPGFLGVKDRQIEKIRLDGSGAEVLTGTPGWHSATVGANGHWVHRWSDANHPDVWKIRGPEGGEALATLAGEAPTGEPLTSEHRHEAVAGEDVAGEDVAGEDVAGLPSWRFFTIPGPDGVNLPAALLQPANLDQSKKYPAVIYHYGGPQSQVVSNSWGNGNRQLWHKWMASRGYVVFMVDNRISDFFGHGGAAKAHRRFGPNNLEAQLAGVKFLKTLEWVDAERIGLWGWSGGGTNTLYCLLNSPGVWKAGVAGAPVTDWRFYDTIWTERYLDRPQENEEGYRLSSPVTYAENLKDHLLIVHGTADDNVHPHNTFAFIHALIEADLPFEDAIYPRQKHGFKHGPYRHFLRRMTEFFDRHLGPPGPMERTGHEDTAGGGHGM